jgi:AcrR family transcriptional regulator
MPREAVATPDRILSAAVSRFAQYGFRRTSMEDIASEAGVSRAALYLQFRNKEEIFRRLAQQLQESAMQRAAEALEGDGPIAERLHAAIEGKSLELVGIMLGSPHGNELMDERNRLCGDLVADGERQFHDALARVLRRAVQAGEIDLGAAGLSPAETASLLLQCVRGLKGPGSTVDDYRRGLQALVRVFVAGLRPPRARAGTAARGATVAARPREPRARRGRAGRAQHSR